MLGVVLVLFSGCATDPPSGRKSGNLHSAFWLWNVLYGVNSYIYDTLWFFCYKVSQTASLPPFQKRRRRIDRSMIGEPTNFVHTAHVGSGDLFSGMNSVSPSRWRTLHLKQNEEHPLWMWLKQWVFIGLKLKNHLLASKFQVLTVLHSILWNIIINIFYIYLQHIVDAAYIVQAVYKMLLKKLILVPCMK